VSELRAILEARRVELAAKYRSRGIAELSDEELAAAKAHTRRLLALAKATGINECSELEKILEAHHAR
jgi:hypothetical protein